MQTACSEAAAVAEAAALEAQHEMARLQAARDLALEQERAAARAHAEEMEAQRLADLKQKEEAKERLRVQEEARRKALEEEQRRAQEERANQLRLEAEAAAAAAAEAARQNEAAVVLQCWSRQCAARAMLGRKQADQWAAFESAEEDALDLKLKKVRGMGVFSRAVFLADLFLMDIVFCFFLLMKEKSSKNICYLVV